MPDPLTIITAASALAGLGKSLFGGTKTLPLDPEVQQIFELLQQRAQEGLTDEEVEQLIEQSKRSIGSEFEAASADSSRRLGLAGAGAGVQQASRSRLNTARLNAVGSAVGNANAADIQSRQQALQLLTGFAPNLRRDKFQTGAGGAQLFGSALEFLIARLGRDNSAGSDLNPGIPGTQASTQASNVNLSGFDFVDPFGSRDTSNIG